MFHSNSVRISIGFGAIGQALAWAFARKNIQVSVAARRPSEAIAPLATAIGPTVTASSMQDALKAQVVILAISFSAISELPSKTNGSGQTVIDPTNAINFPDFTPVDLAGKFSSSLVQKTLSGAKVVKAFNTIPAAILAQSPDEDGGRPFIIGEFVAHDSSPQFGSLNHRGLARRSASGQAPVKPQTAQASENPYLFFWNRTHTANALRSDRGADARSLIACSQLSIRTRTSART
ncbi:NADPH-dependent F420 reductase [Rhizobium anhuiense]|nr:NAD(P)-binding domain-containing protein [Rhizobium anhuiense]